MITIIGPGTEEGDLTLGALEALQGADTVLVRNSCPAAEALTKKIACETLDYIYQKSRSFDSLAKNIASEVKRLSQGKNLCYCVEGGVVEDRAAQLLIEKCKPCVIEGVSKSAKAAAKANLNGQYTAVSAYAIGEATLSLPLVVYDIDNSLLASDVKLLLADKYGDEAQAFFISDRGGKNISLYEADRQEGANYNARTALVLYEIPLLEKKRFDFSDLVEILKRLRAPDGCPWDRVQTHESIRINAIEEAYELVDAIDLNDPEKMCEEAGDVLMQSLFHTLIEEESGRFSLNDMLSGICEKLITRHTHVFGTDKAAGADGALSVWEKNKMTEKKQTTFSDAVNDVPECFPALLRAQKCVKRMAKGGWSFTDLQNSKKKLDEEFLELIDAVSKNDREQIQGELGDVLMVVAGLAYAVNGDAEMALLDTVKKVTKRYNVWEKLVTNDKKDVNKLTKEEWFYYYNLAKEQCEHGN